MSKKSLPQLYREHTGKVSHRWSLYLDVYDAAFAPWRELPVTVVEVGVQNGGSLELWGQYFKAARAIIGCDVDERCGALRFDDPRLTVIVGPINAESTAREIVARAEAIDIFIDDGSHVSTDIVAAFCNYFPRMRPGGMYVAEDLHCAYHPDWQGGLSRPNAMGFFKLLVDGMHQDYWQEPAELRALAAPFLPPGAAVDVSRLAADAASIAFYDSMCFVRKRPATGWGRLGERVVVGEEAAVDPAPLRLHGAG